MKIIESIVLDCVIVDIVLPDIDGYKNLLLYKRKG